MANMQKFLRSLKDITVGQFSLLKQKIAADRNEKSAEKKDINVSLPEVERSSEEVIVRFSLASVAKSTFIVALIALGGYLIVELREILLVVMLAFFLSTALVPSVQFLERYKINRGISVIGIYLVTILFFSLFASQLFPVLVSEISQLGENLPQVVESFVSWKPGIAVLESPVASLQTWVQQIDLADEVVTQLTVFSRDVLSFFSLVFASVFKFVLVLVLAFFLTMEREAVIHLLVTLFPKEYEPYIEAKTKAMQIKIGYWLQGQLLLMLVIGIVTYIGLLILGVDSALTLAVFAGLAELLPVIGPIVAFLVAVPVAANQSLWLVLFVGILFFIVQQLENNVFVPMIMKKAVGLSPVVVLIAMLIGEHFLGILGLILSIPVATTIGLFVSDLLKEAEKH